MKQNVNYGPSIRFLCLALGTQASADDIRTQLPTTELEWQQVLRLANQHLLAPALYLSLRNNGLLESIDAKLSEFLHEVYEHNATRNEQLVKQMQEVAELLNHQGIQPVLLKGVGALVEDLFGDIGSRGMLDIDILVAEDEVHRAYESLIAAGFYSTYENQSEAPQHLPRLFQKNMPAGLELHDKLQHEMFAQTLSTSSVIAQSRPCQPWGDQGAIVRLMCSEHQVIHNFLHSQVGHQNHDCFRLDLRQMFHFSALALKYKHDLDWMAVEAAMETSGHQHKYAIYQASVASLFEDSQASTKNDSRYLNVAIQMIGKRLPFWVLVKLEITALKRAFSPSHIRMRFRAKNSFEVVFFALKHLLFLIKKSINTNIIKERLMKYNR